MLERLEPPFLDLHAATWTSRDAYEMRPDARRFENWENYVAGKIGLGVAVDYALGFGLEAIWARVQGLAAGIRRRLGEMEGVAVHDLGATQCGIISFTVAGHEPADLMAAMAARGISIHVTSRPSTLIDFEDRDIRVMNRLGVHYYNSEAEIERFFEVLGDLVG